MSPLLTELEYQGVPFLVYLLEENQESDACIMVCPNLGGLLCTYPHPPLGADEVRGESWQLVTAIHDEADALTLCE
jgi:hypothetical protein